MMSIMLLQLTRACDELSQRKEEGWNIAAVENAESPMETMNNTSIDNLQLAWKYDVIQKVIIFTFISTDATALAHAGFEQRSGPVALDNVQCVGTEDRLVDCPYDQSAVNCSDASVQCQITREYTTNKLNACKLNYSNEYKPVTLLVQIMTSTY